MQSKFEFLFSTNLQSELLRLLLQIFNLPSGKVRVHRGAHPRPQVGGARVYEPVPLVELKLLARFAEDRVADGLHAPLQARERFDDVRTLEKF